MSHVVAMDITKSYLLMPGVILVSFFRETLKRENVSSIYTMMIPLHQNPFDI